ncbi:MAG: hypothetical protein RLZZ69_1649 [Cyanobacteriota bacterium]|jgi:hypothetical protein
MYRIYLEAYRSIWFFQVRIKTKYRLHNQNRDRLKHFNFSKSDRSRSLKGVKMKGLKMIDSLIGDRRS